jgi:hypothetical protein
MKLPSNEAYVAYQAPNAIGGTAPAGELRVYRQGDGRIRCYNNSWPIDLGNTNDSHAIERNVLALFHHLTLGLGVPAVEVHKQFLALEAYAAYVDA